MFVLEKARVASECQCLRAYLSKVLPVCLVTC